MTADAGGLCLKSGNAVILRERVGEFSHLARDLPMLCTEGLADAGLPEAAIQLVPTVRARGGRFHA